MSLTLSHRSNLSLEEMNRLKELPLSAGAEGLSNTSLNVIRDSIKSAVFSVHPEFRGKDIDWLIEMKLDQFFETKARVDQTKEENYYFVSEAYKRITEEVIEVCKNDRDEIAPEFAGDNMISMLKEVLPERNTLMQSHATSKMAEARAPQAGLHFFATGIDQAQSAQDMYSFVTTNGPHIDQLFAALDGIISEHARVNKFYMKQAQKSGNSRFASLEYFESQVQGSERLSMVLNQHRTAAANFMSHVHTYGTAHTPALLYYADELKNNVKALGEVYTALDSIAHSRSCEPYFEYTYTSHLVITGSLFQLLIQSYHKKNNAWPSEQHVKSWIAHFYEKNAHHLDAMIAEADPLIRNYDAGMTSYMPPQLQGFLNLQMAEAEALSGADFKEKLIVNGFDGLIEKEVASGKWYELSARVKKGAYHLLDTEENDELVATLADQRLVELCPHAKLCEQLIGKIATITQKKGVPSLDPYADTINHYIGLLDFTKSKDALKRDILDVAHAVVEHVVTNHKYQENISLLVLKVRNNHAAQQSFISVKEFMGRITTAIANQEFPRSTVARWTADDLITNAATVAETIVAPERAEFEALEEERKEQQAQMLQTFVQYSEDFLQELFVSPAFASNLVLFGPEKLAELAMEHRDNADYEFIPDIRYMTAAQKEAFVSLVGHVRYHTISEQRGRPQNTVAQAVMKARSAQEDHTPSHSAPKARIFTARKDLDETSTSFWGKAKSKVMGWFGR